MEYSAQVNKAYTLTVTVDDMDGHIIGASLNPSDVDIADLVEASLSVSFSAHHLERQTKL